MDRRYAQIASLLIAFAGLMVSMWQIEEIWRSLQNGWAYNLPFGFATYDYWFAHDFWFTMIFVCMFYVTMVALKINLKE